MARDCFIGIDQGSSSTKALAIGMDGQVLVRIKKDLSPPLRAENRVEQDPREILGTVQEALDETVKQARASGFSPQGIGLSCQRSSCLAWNEASVEPLSPVLSWRDRRGLDRVQKLSEQAALIFDRSGLPLTPYYSASKLRWLKEHTPAADYNTTVFGTLSSFLTQRLTGNRRALIDHTNAARTQLMNISTLQWDDALLDLFGLSGVRLPAIVPTAGAFGAAKTAAGDVPLLASMGDQQAAMLGLGVVDRGDGGINYGTGGFLVVNTGTKLVPVKGLMASVHYSSGAETAYLIEGSVNAVGDGLEWLRSRLHLFSDYRELDGLCREAADEVIAFIGLNGTGAPHWESAISTSFHGMTAESAPADIVRAVVEGIAFFMKDIAGEIERAGLEPGAFTISGGLASLGYLAQVQADIMGEKILVGPEQEVSALGAALLAGLAAGAWTTEDIRNRTRPARAIEPRRNEGLAKRYQRWQELHRLTKKIDAL